MVVNAETGEVAQEIEYDVWGNVLSDTNEGLQPFYFAGGIYDADTGLTRFGARDYDPQTGRWTAKDPIGFNGGLTSLYDYVGGDPVNKIDPSGEKKMTQEEADNVMDTVFPGQNHQEAPNISDSCMAVCEDINNDLNGIQDVADEVKTLNPGSVTKPGLSSLAKWLKEKFDNDNGRGTGLAARNGAAIANKTEFELNCK